MTLDKFSSTFDHSQLQQQNSQGIQLEYKQKLRSEEDEFASDSSKEDSLELGRGSKSDVKAVIQDQKLQASIKQAKLLMNQSPSLRALPTAKPALPATQNKPLRLKQTGLKK
eukprot:CAMPEP_0202977480 /NCGR_PEP_ID=MMETSP1396-20130829/84271_1 /ASSEMBLY_ACC=CAM_ASM_000872 /TAXON_ID= /ORGANISM="Pseudokeronopsis sp., Strain Brazil" /LENGTH=111 /DNA_ID=CAMNT_0049716229 /DNA_START=88 /DNA_END=423 /DNA_ORIENTATION=-